MDLEVFYQNEGSIRDMLSDDEMDEMFGKGGVTERNSTDD